MTKEELEGLQALVDELSRKGYQETTVSGLTRQALEKWEHVYRETEAGNYMNTQNQPAGERRFAGILKWPG